VAFGDDRSGVVVDTHVRRLAERLGWATGRGLHSSTFSAQREPFLTQNTPYIPHVTR